MPLVNVEDAATVEVGKFYLVRCARVRARWPEQGWYGWLPLLGDVHEDTAILNFPQRHAHYDWRFISEEMRQRLAPHIDLPDYVVSFIAHEGQIERVERRRRRCVRVAPTFPGNPPPTFRLDKLEDAFADVRLKPDCRTCPHRGLPLAGMPTENGATVCAGHGLAWDLATGRMVRRRTAETQAVTP